MKKLSLVIAALAMMLGITQCKKQEDPVGGKLITQKVTFTTSFGNGSKLGVNEEGGGLDLSWQVGDKITVSDDATTPNVSTLECKSVSNNGLTGTFEGTITCIEGTHLTFTVGNEPDYMDQHFTAINESEIYLVGESDFEQSGNYEVDMALPYAILKVDLAELATAEDAIVSVKIGDAVEPIAKVTGVKTGACQVYLLLPLAATGQTVLTFTNTTSNKTITHTYTLAPNGFYTGGGNGGMALILPDGALPGVFTVSADGKKVRFSQGNLQAVKRGDTWNDCTWQFAATQYETVEYKDQNVGENYSNTGIQSLFGWGDVNHKTSKEDTYTWPVSSDPWGTMIDDQGTWRVLSGNSTGEWKYLLETRMMLNGKPRYTNKINGIQIPQGGTIYKGLFIYPDDYSGAEVGAGGPSTWDEINDAGIVFLPATGYRNNPNIDNSGTLVYNVGSEGSYWSSSPSSGSAYRFVFYGSSIYTDNPTGRYRGFSVRLVRDVK